MFFPSHRGKTMNHRHKERGPNDYKFSGVNFCGFRSFEKSTNLSRAKSDSF